MKICLYVYMSTCLYMYICLYVYMSIYKKPVAPGEITTKRSWVNCPALISLQEVVEITKPRIPLTTPVPGTVNAVTMAQQCE